MKPYLLQLLLTLFCGMLSHNAIAQFTTFKNPSFEDTPRHSHVPIGWTNCGGHNETPPDTHPSGAFSVNIPAHDGYTYIGMVTRDNGTVESVGQSLNQPLKADSTYIFFAMACSAPYFFSLSRSTGKEVNYISPVLLAVYGSTDVCSEAVPLAFSSKITFGDWQQYMFEIQPKKDINSLIFQVETIENRYYANGNILLDHLSPVYALNQQTNVELLAIQHRNTAKPRELTFQDENPNTISRKKPLATSYKEPIRSYKRDEDDSFSLSFGKRKKKADNKSPFGFLKKKEKYTKDGEAVKDATLNGSIATEIFVDNPSFEEIPDFNIVPAFWTYRGTKNNYRTSILPDRETFPDVRLQAYRGKSYLAMEVLADGTYDAISQQIHPTEVGLTYEMSFYLAKAKNYWDVNREIEFDQPINLEIWASKDGISKDQLISSTQLIRNTKWKKHKLTFESNGQWTHLILQASFNENKKEAYNGHLLIDQISTIQIKN
ncbi:MAG: hypothetical protein MRY78_16905 [Saprospiraceae bacterium]|nr:hypothetical protein [Saprospiraceae bacterium]